MAFVTGKCLMCGENGAPLWETADFRWYNEYIEVAAYGCDGKKMHSDGLSSVAMDFAYLSWFNTFRPISLIGQTIKVPKYTSASPDHKSTFLIDKNEYTEVKLPDKVMIIYRNTYRKMCFYYVDPQNLDESDPKTIVGMELDTLFQLNPDLKMDKIFPEPLRWLVLSSGENIPGFSELFEKMKSPQ